MLKNVKNTTFPGPLDLLAPHSCRGCGCIGTVLCDRCKNYIFSHSCKICPNCKSPTKSGCCPNCPDFPATFIAGERDDLIGELVHDYKYNSVRALARPLAEAISNILPPLATPIAIVPLPTISRHIRERGFDHTYLIAKYLTRCYPGHCRVVKALSRVANTTQVGANRLARLTQADAAYAISSHFHPHPDTTYILLDDVWTTGASCRAAIKKLRHAGVSNDQIIVAILALSRIDQ